MNPSFGHARSQLAFWRTLLKPLVGRQPTPFYLFAVAPIEQALLELDGHFGQLPVRHWLSFKTQPLRPLVQWWRKQGRPVEVVSEFEFLAARAEGFAPDEILINGPAKHRWLPHHGLRGLKVNFDSLNEALALAPLAKKLDWICGVRFLTREEFDPEKPGFATQFGFTPDEAVQAIRKLKRAGVRLATAHFHLRTNVASAAIYERALREVAETCRAAGFAPRHVDCGGGFPPPQVQTRSGQAVDKDFNLAEMARVYARTLKLFPEASELWLENGRWMSARSGVLVARILDIKERGGVRVLICDGGRTLNALISNWETHGLFTIPERRGPTVLTAVHGPTCMAFDQLVRCPLPRSLRVGDHLVWMDAGAYHLPWETRFSHGLAAVFWHDGQRVRVVRKAERFAKWWSQQK
jgi:diaminopimelate decarboxylase